MLPTCMSTPFLKTYSVRKRSTNVDACLAGDGQRRVITQFVLKPTLMPTDELTAAVESCKLRVATFTKVSHLVCPN